MNVSFPTYTISFIKGRTKSVFGFFCFFSVSPVSGALYVLKKYLLIEQ